MLRLYIAIFFLSAAAFFHSSYAQPVRVRKEYLTTLTPLCDALIKRQVNQKNDKSFGAIKCEHCKVLHTRASEAVYPFAVLYTATRKASYLEAALNTADWLMKQQEQDGSWKETPEEWKGTTTDQLLMLLLSFEQINSRLDKTEKRKWKLSMRKAAQFLDSVMSPEYASINYVATTSATLAKAGILLNDSNYLHKAKKLARRVVSKMDEDGFINGEGGRSHGNKQGVDLGYDMEMSLWGLGLYSRLTDDHLVDSLVKKALANHLYFIYPDGSMDASWGIRSNKWTGFGSATSDGCQVLFSLYAATDPMYASASIRNLEFIRKNMADDLIGYGLMHTDIFNSPPCIYPTFTKAKNIAMAYELEGEESRTLVNLPSDKSGWIKLFKTLDVIEVRTENFMATITAYRYKDPAGSKGKYMFRPSGGTISHLWMKNHGFLQASSPTIYTRPEPMSFPEAPGVLCLTPRVEYTDSAGYFTNLFEFDSRMFMDSSVSHFDISVSGEIKDRNQLAGGVGYAMDYLFADSFIQKSISLIYHDARPAIINIIEPFVNMQGTRFDQKDEYTVLITRGKTKILFQVLSSNAELIAGRNKEDYWSPYPALRAFPIELQIKPDPDHFSKTVVYRVSVLP